jgi:hypothetical protein
LVELALLGVKGQIVSVTDLKLKPPGMGWIDKQSYLIREKDRYTS